MYHPFSFARFAVSARFVLFCFLASTYNLQLSDYSVETLIRSKSKEAGKEAILVGEILRHAARELAQNKAHYSEVRTNTEL